MIRWHKTVVGPFFNGPHFCSSPVRGGPVIAHSGSNNRRKILWRETTERRRREKRQWRNSQFVPVEPSTDAPRPVRRWKIYVSSHSFFLFNWSSSVENVQSVLLLSLIRRRRWKRSMIELTGRLGRGYRHDMAALLMHSYSEVTLSVSQQELSNSISSLSIALRWLSVSFLFDLSGLFSVMVKIGDFPNSYQTLGMRCLTPVRALAHLFRDLICLFSYLCRSYLFVGLSWKQFCICRRTWWHTTHLGKSKRSLSYLCNVHDSLKFCSFSC